MKKLLAFLVLLAAPVAAQEYSVSYPLVWAVDLDGTYTYFTSAGVGRDLTAVNTATSVDKLIITSGSSTTLEDVNSDGPFTGLGVGDIMIFVFNGVYYVRAVATVTSVNEITVDTAVNLTSGVTFQWRDLSSGTGAENGWFTTSNLKSLNILINIPTLNATSVDFRIECRGVDPTPVLVDTTSATSTGLYSRQINLEYWPFRQCRVGMKTTVDAGTQAINVQLIETRLK